MENEYKITVQAAQELSDIIMLDSRRYDNNLRGEQ